MSVSEMRDRERVTSKVHGSPLGSGVRGQLM